MNTRQFILTRFNGGLYNVVKKIPALDADVWMKRRIELFSSICVPSIAAQTNKDFVWVLSIDPRTPPKYVDQIRKLLRGIDYCLVDADQYSVIYQGPKFAKCVAGEIKEWPCKIITTRLDNDDAIRTTFVDRVRSKFASKSSGALYFGKGFVLDIKTQKVKRASRSQPGNTSSLCETVNGPEQVKTALAVFHSDIGKLAPVERVGGMGMWLVSKHDLNLHDYLRKGRSLANRRQLKQFNLHLDSIGKYFGGK